MKKLLVTIYFLIMAVLYVFVYGSIVLFAGFLIKIFAGEKVSRRFVNGQIKLFGKIPSDGCFHLLLYMVKKIFSPIALLLQITKA